jgi:4-cresol dehydrogenase (hydroxylating)
MTKINRRAALGLAIGGAATALAAGVETAFAGAELPQGLSKARFDRALDELRAIVGKEWVFADPDSIRPYEKCLIPDPTHRHVPCGAVAPASTEEVQAVVRVAGRYRLPLWPISTGKNMGYGSATPATPGQVILDLKRMNRILNVDPDLATALVEPGVTYQQLVDYLEANKIPLWIDVPTVGPIVGPVGNTLDRGVGYTPYGEHFMFQCGMEVVLASGDILRTGMGSLKNSTTWQAFKWGYGPYLDGLFTQSNFGVVTKMGLWLMPKPPVYKPFTVRHRAVDDIARLVDAMRPLRISQMIPNCVLMMGAAYQLAMFKRRSEVWTGEGPVTDEAVERVARANELGMWNSYFALYGTEEMVAAIEPVVRGALTASGGEVLTEREMNGNPWFEHHKALMRGGLNLDEIGLARWRGAGGGLAWFAPVAPAKGAETHAQTALAREILGKYGFDYTAAWVIGWRELHHICALLFDRTDAGEHAKADACYRELVVRFAERGWGSYRTGVAYMDLVANQFGAMNRKINQSLKRALDPAGVLAPGKSGIV